MFLVQQFRSQVPEELLVDYFDYQNLKFTKTKIQISLTTNKEIKYISSEGSILRIDYIKEPSKKYDLITNLEQIQHLKWQGEFGKNDKKIGRWIAIWKGQTLEAVNRWYSEDGLQSGLQTELINNYWSKADIYVYGEYYNYQKQGVWKFIIQDNMIVGGLYKYGQKVGKWIDLNDSVQNQNQIVYNGEYKNGNKIGLWNILYKSKDSNYKIIGGGQYDENGQKNGRWIDLNNVFWNKSEVIYHGQYKNGLKIGKWDTNDLQNTQNNQISYSIIF
ncbi:unnamed protein product [Paramecium pentaurelia]|uniref:MORN repeat protein n=1 Tax=Paramecium pentaurelia TaxID=43138 RepID=A0A8S1UMD9_9CILI|nr:unnamed protein product [Paramecium pentaurelia]